MTALRHAFAFLTIFPVGPANKPPTASASAFFPMVGLALGGVLAGLDFILRDALPMPVVGAVLLAALLILTRAIHTEGFLDSCDGLLGGRSRNERLRILRDSHVGAFAVIGGVSLLLLKWALLAGGPSEIRTELLALFPCLSRFGMLSTMSAFSYVRDQGLGTTFSGSGEVGGKRSLALSLPSWLQCCFWELGDWRSWVHHSSLPYSWDGGYQG